MPDGGSIDIPISLNYAAVADIARNAAREEVSKSQGKDWWRKQFLQWDTMNEILGKVDDRMTEKIPLVTTKAMEEFIQRRLPGEISREMRAYFPTFISDNDMIKSHLHKHIVDISVLMDRKKEGIVAELTRTAKLTADEMSRSDQFGKIYASIAESTRRYIVEESSNTKEAILSQMNAELTRTRVERETLMQELHSTKVQLNDSLKDQQKFKWMAGSSFGMSLVSLAGLVFIYTQKK
jgi:hypothetical protein